MKKAAHHAKASNLVALGVNAQKPKQNLLASNNPSSSIGAIPLHYHAFNKKQIIQRTLKNYPHQKTELGPLVKKLISTEKSEEIETIFLELLYRLKEAIQQNLSNVRGAIGRGAKPPIPPLYYLPVLHAVSSQKHQLVLRESEHVIDALCQMLVSHTTNVPSGNMHHAMKNLEPKQVIGVTACHILQALLDDVNKWPEVILKCWLEDSSNPERTWSEDPLCQEFCENIKSAFISILPETCLDNVVTTKKSAGNPKSNTSNSSKNSSASRSSPITVPDGNRSSSPSAQNSYWTVRQRYPDRKVVREIVNHYMESYCTCVKNSDIYLH